MESRHRVVKFILRAAGVGMVYSIFTIFRKEMILEQARVIKEYPSKDEGSRFGLEETSNCPTRRKKYLSRPSNTWTTMLAIDTSTA